MVPDLCTQCQHRRPPDAAAQQSLTSHGGGASVQAALNRRRNDIETHKRREELAHRSQGRGISALERRPILYDWCAAQSNTQQGVYYFCDWLKTESCRYREAPPAPLDAVSGPATSALPEPHLATEQMSAIPAAQTGTAAEEGPFRVPLGTAYRLRPKSVDENGSALGVGSFQIDYEHVDLVNLRPAIAGAGLRQTYLIFGGPGAGKTYYFQYLLGSLLAHRSRPGCLLLDPKGALTGWLETTLKAAGRIEDLRMLKAGADLPAFNVLAGGLSPKELGRLLSEVVLSGAPGIDEGWAVLVGDLLESAAVVIAADPTVDLTAAQLLKDILYRARFTYPDGKQELEYPIVYRAKRVALQPSATVDARIAADRIAEYFSNAIEPRQRRFVRQIVERTLAELALPEWRYLSGSMPGDSVYTDIIERGRVVSVAVGQSSPAFQRSMSTLVKSIFQQAALAHLSRHKDDPPKKEVKPDDDPPFYILACDEYAQAITEGQTGLVSDSRFFSLSREAGCLSLLALQSVATGRSRFSADMRDRWEGILGNVTVKLFMKLNDFETAKMASDLAGSQHSFVAISSQQQSAQGLSTTDSLTMLEHPRVPPWYLTNRLPQGHALVHGTLDGKAEPTSLFVRVPQHK